MSKKNLLINAIFSLIVILYIPVILESFKEPLHSYSFSELHINYLGGFIRRGFLGELGRLFFPTINNLYFFSLIFGILYFVHIFIFYKLLKKFENFSVIIIFLSLSPSLLLFPLTHPENYMRKDIFFIIAILSHSLYLFKNEANKISISDYGKFQKIYLIPFLFLNILIHEAQIFFISVHILLSYFFININFTEFFKTKYFKIYLILIIPFIFVILNPGNPAQIEQIKNYAISLPYLSDPGPFDALYGNINLQLGLILKSFYYYTYKGFVSLLSVFILSIVSIILLFHYLIDKKIISIKSSLNIFYFIFFVPCLFIFVAGSDFGRWFNILGFHFLSFYFLLDIKKKKKFSFNLRTWIIIWIGLFSYIFLWTLPVGCCFWEPEIFKSSLFNQIYNLILETYHFINTNIIELPLNNFMK